MAASVLTGKQRHSRCTHPFNSVIHVDLVILQNALLVRHTIQSSGFLSIPSVSRIGRLYPHLDLDSQIIIKILVLLVLILFHHMLKMRLVQIVTIQKEFVD